MIELDTVEELSTTTVEDIIGNHSKLVVFNDPINSFEHVEEVFMKYLKFSSEQAQQCAYIIHTKGKYAVKSGTKEELLPYKTALDDEGLTTEIQ
jgi:ATP-dependent Clp protease adaptor protein ClpS